jgi:hypothetical protein
MAGRRVYRATSSLPFEPVTLHADNLRQLVHLLRMDVGLTLHLRTPLTLHSREPHLLDDNYGE